MATPSASPTRSPSAPPSPSATSGSKSAADSTRRAPRPRPEQHQRRVRREGPDLDARDPGDAEGQPRGDEHAEVRGAAQQDGQLLREHVGRALRVVEGEQRRLRLLRRGDGGRKDALDAAIAWSWELLDPEEREALAQCAVFRGGFTLPSAEASVRLHDERSFLLDLLEALQGKSLLRVDPGGSGPRLLPDENVRFFALARLAPEVVRSEAERRHALHYLAEAERRTGGALDTSGPVLDWLAGEQQNLRAVDERFLVADPALAARAALALEPMLRIRGLRGSGSGRPREPARQPFHDPILRYGGPVSLSTGGSDLR